MTNSPGLSSGSMVMADMTAAEGGQGPVGAPLLLPTAMAQPRFSQWGGAEAGELGGRCLLTTLLLLTGAEAGGREREREKKKETGRSGMYICEKYITRSSNLCTM